MVCLAAKEEFDVIRLIEHNKICYVSSEYVRGRSLPGWIKFHPCVEKEKLFQMIQDIVNQLSQIHRCGGNPCYQYVNPYSIIVSEEGKTGFLDINAESNNDLLRLMQRRTVREHFLPPEEPYYQKASVELDIYGLGKVLQYMLSEVEVEPPLKRSEEAKFQKIISKCLNRHSKKVFQNVSEIQKMIPRYEKREKNQVKGKKRLVMSLSMAAGIIIVILGSGTIRNSESRNNDAEIIEDTKQQRKREPKAETNAKEDYLNMQLGTVYFLELENYEKSKVYFSSAKGNSLAGYMSVIAECFTENNVSQTRLRQALADAEKMVEAEDEEKIGEKRIYYQCILKGYALLEKKEDAQNVLRIGKICMKDAKNEDMAEILGYMASAYERQDEIAEAVDIYGEQMKYEEDETAREELYKKTANLLLQSEQKEQAQELLRKGIEEFEKSSELRTIYIGIQLKDSNIDRQICVQNIREQLKEMPELKEYEEFQKLMKEYRIHVEGEKVWQEK